MRLWLHARAMGAIRAVAWLLQTLPQKHQRNVMDGFNPPSATKDINKKFMAYARCLPCPAVLVSPTETGGHQLWWSAPVLPIDGPQTCLN